MLKLAEKANYTMRSKTRVLIFLCLLLGGFVFFFNLPDDSPGCPRSAQKGLPDQETTKKSAPESSIDSPSESEEEENSLPFLPRGKHRLPGSGDVVDKNVPIVFIGGVPRSGTTIMRVIADAHPNVYCGEETRVVPAVVLGRKKHATPIEKARLTAAGITQEILDEAATEYILKILTRDSGSLQQKDHISMLCDKDPFNLMAMDVLKHMFPNAKFLLMIRDGRAVAHSLITRKVTIGGWNLNSYADTLSKWSSTIKRFVNECDSQTPVNCMKVFYEQLVLQPNNTIRAIARFLNVPWDDKMLHHQDEVGKTISYSKLERSTDQVAKPINLLGLDSWVGHIPDNILKDVETHAPMLKTLGYDLSPNPYYGEPDDLVKKNLQLLRQNPEKYKVETYKFENGKVIKGPQYGAEKMKQHQEESQLGIRNPDYLKEENAKEKEKENLQIYYHPKRRKDPLYAERKPNYRNRRPPS